MRFIGGRGYLAQQRDKSEAANKVSFQKCNLTKQMYNDVIMSLHQC